MDLLHDGITRHLANFFFHAPAVQGGAPLYPRLDIVFDHFPAHAAPRSVWAPVRTCWFLAGFKMLTGLHQLWPDAGGGGAARAGGLEL